MLNVTPTPEEFTRLLAELERLRALVDEQRRRLERQAETILQQDERIRELEARLGKNSRNSSQPPSSDPPFKKPPPKSRRQRSGRTPGGQAGHPGVTLKLTEAVDRAVTIPLSGTCACGQAWSAADAVVLPERRQVIDLVIRREVIEYRIVAGTCACGCTRRSDFPATVTAPVQYGAGVSALAVYLTQYQLLPYGRSAELFDTLAGIAIAPGTLQRMVATAAERLAAPVAAIREAVMTAPVAHADETGLRVGGTLHWLHVLSTAELSAYFAHPKRGAEALTAFGWLTRFGGVLVHDHWPAYLDYDGPHAFCNAHHLRELIALAELLPTQTWPQALIALLCEANDAVIQARADRSEALPAPVVAQFQARYEAILAEAAAQHPPRPRPPSQPRGRVKQSPAFNLIARLRDHRDGVLRFLTDPRVPFDNNQAERDVRMPKLKQKVSGCFRSAGGAEQFATIRSYLSTLRKQAVDLFQALVLTFQETPPMPRLAMAE